MEPPTPPPPGSEREGDPWQVAEKLRPYLTFLAARILGLKVAVKTSPSDVVQQSLVKALRQKRHAPTWTRPGYGPG